METYLAKSFFQFSNKHLGEKTLKEILIDNECVSIEISNAMQLEFWSTMSQVELGNNFETMNNLGYNGFTPNLYLPEQTYRIELSYWLPSKSIIEGEFNDVAEVIYKVIEHYKINKKNLEFHHFHDLWIETIHVFKNGKIEIGLGS